MAPEQQPVGHDAAVQTQAPSWQACPCAHVPLVQVPPQPSEPPQPVQEGVQQPPSKQDWPAPHTAHWPPGEPQALPPSPGSQTAPRQQPNGHEAAVQRQTPVWQTSPAGQLPVWHLPSQPSGAPQTVQVGVQQPASGPTQAPHWQSLPQLWVPQAPQACCVPATQGPASAHSPYASQPQVAEQPRLWLPQLPQVWLCCSPGWHCGFVWQLGTWQPASTKQTSPAGHAPPAQVPPQPSDWLQPASAQEAPQQLPLRQVCDPVQQLPPPPALAQKAEAGQHALPTQTSVPVQTVLPQGCPQTPPTQLPPLEQMIPTQAAGSHSPW